jgi:5-methyltetrahydropteroyltriglutamate--homocysteine methyltransferase
VGTRLIARHWQAQAEVGLVTSKRGILEDKDFLKRRIDEAAKFVPLEQICLSPQCGFSSTVDGNSLTVGQEIAKLALVVDTTRCIVLFSRSSPEKLAS